MKDYSEKRDFHRMQVNSQIAIATGSGEQLIGTCVDLSATGMQLSVDRALPLGEELKTRLEPASDQFPPLETVCEVVRCEPDGDRFLLGLNITEVLQ
ncbi:MAG TPA: PilZ domain-containing protein [Marinobacter sp.]|jgi:hypothetical protein|nr:PilZ domain-containing protein [Marinobacter sp.]